MNEKRTVVDFVKENKGKLIKGVLIVGGLIFGWKLASAVLNRGGLEVLEAVENLNPGELIGVGEQIGEAASTVLM